MEYIINTLYWALIYKAENFPIWTLETIRGPYFNHLFPFVILNIEWLLNGFHFNSKQTLRYFTIMGFTFFTVNYTGSIYQGKPVYDFLNYKKPQTFLVIIGIMLF
jgi:hypothetical protein